MDNLSSIENLSLQEKIELMERLWSEISTSPEYNPPEWHEKELKKRKKRVSEGIENYLDWDKVKREIRKEIK